MNLGAAMVWQMLKAYTLKSFQSTLPIRSNRSPAFSIHSIICIGQWSLFSNHQLTRVLRSQTAPSGMPHLTCGTSFLLLFVFLNSILHHYPALLHHHTLIFHRLLTFLVAFSIVILKVTFSQRVFHSITVFPLLRLISWNYDHSLFGGGSIGKCGSF